VGGAATAGLGGQKKEEWGQRVVRAPTQVVLSPIPLPHLSHLLVPMGIPCRSSTHVEPVIAQIWMVAARCTCNSLSLSDTHTRTHTHTRARTLRWEVGGATDSEGGGRGISGVRVQDCRDGDFQCTQTMKGEEVGGGGVRLEA
jgi:hypothetical protein